MSLINSRNEPSEKIIKNDPSLHGLLYFNQDDASRNIAHPYAIMRHNIHILDVIHLMHSQWGIKAPRIVTVIISNFGSLGEWVTSRQLSHFKEGLVKAAQQTNMWILTNGASGGVSRIIGDIVHELAAERRMLKSSSTSPKSPQCNLIGIMREENIRYADNLRTQKPNDDGTLKVTVTNKDVTGPKQELNPNHTHFLIVRDNTLNKSGLNLFMMRLLTFLSTLDTSELGDEENTSGESSTEALPFSDIEIPILAILIQGGYDCARLVLDCLKKKFPVLVLGGTGGVADLIAFAYRQLEHRKSGAGIWDSEYVDSLLKPELSSRIANYFPKIGENSLARNLLRDRILETVRLANQDNLCFLSILDINNYPECKLENLSVYMLKALFRSKKTEKKEDESDEHIFKELYLTLDWNCPEVAESQIISKNVRYLSNLPKGLFQTALLQPDREEFVNLFLTYGFSAHKFVTPTRLRRLFQYSYNQEFFQTVCWEGLLGHSLLNQISKDFIKTDLNWLIELSTGFPNFVSQDDLYLSVVGMYVRDKVSAERHALTILTMWAVFSYRTKLAKVLWKNSDQPIHLGLISAIIYKRLSAYVMETNLRDELLQTSKEFVIMSVGVLDQCYHKSASRAFDVLNEKNPKFGNKTAVDISAIGAFKEFLAHPCCQIWLNKTFLGDIRIRETSWGIFSIPASIKILASAFFVFPMYFWVRFPRDEYKNDVEKMEMEVDEDDTNVSNELMHDNSSKYRFNLPVSRIRRSLRRNIFNVIESREIFLKQKLPIYRMINLMWTAPITKFYTFQVSFVIFLGLFSLALLWPSCGHPLLDSTVCLWSWLIAVENIHHSVRLYKNYGLIQAISKTIEFSVLIGFLIAYTGYILGLKWISSYDRKIILSFGLIYFFYTLIAVYLPISPTLGPLLYSLQLMMVVDFFNFLKMALLMILFGGIILQALFYPNLDLTPEVIKTAFTRAWLSLFLTPTNDLYGNSECDKYRNDGERADTCHAGVYRDVKEAHACPEPSIWPYIFTLQYFVFLKLILLTLLYALFSYTASRVDTETDAIWKYQRYFLVLDFANRNPLPPPLNILYYIFTGIKALCNSCQRKQQEEENFLGPFNIYPSKLSSDDFRFWKYLAKDYSKNEERKLKEDKSFLQQRLDLMNLLNEEIGYQRRVIENLRGQLGDLTRMMGSYQASVESRSKEKGFGETQHTFSRKSPYPGTRIQRIPVADKFVPWEVRWVEYDPVSYTMDKNDFPLEYKQWVDEDLNERDLMPVLKWNNISTSAAGISIDRRSWILDSKGNNLIYKLEGGIPVNPYGRTGLKGKGALPRWGPNHFFIIIITRLKEIGSVGKIAEFVGMQKGTEAIRLLSIFIPGDELFANVSNLFKITTPWTDESHLASFFHDNAINHSHTEVAPCPLVNIEWLRGCYMDDRLNTDQAWKEVRAVHVHYEIGDNLHNVMEEGLEWRVISEHVLMRLSSGESNLLQRVTMKLKTDIV